MTNTAFPAPADRFESIQVARALAALAVMLVHAELVRRDLAGDEYTHGLWQFGQAGVDLFFVISGFIIAAVVERAPDVRAFVGCRLLRILPLYWLFTIAMMLALVLRGEAWPEPASLAASLLILPQRAAPVLGVGWSLEHEIVFYAITAALLATGRPRALPVVMAGLGVGAVLLALVSPPGAEFDGFHLLSLYQLQFLAGLLLHRRRASVARLPWPATILLGAALFPLAAAALHLLSDGIAPAQPIGWLGIARVLLFGAAASVLLAGLIAWEAQAPGMLRPGAMRALIAVGGASFSLYLCHPVVFALFAPLFGRWWPAGLSVGWSPLVASGVAVVLALLAYGVVERPLLRRLARPAAAWHPGARAFARPRRPSAT